MATYFPLFLELKNAHVIVFGGKNHALYRIKNLLPYHPNITVVATEVCDEIANLAAAKTIALVSADPTSAQKILAEWKPRLVIVADTDESTARTIFALCQEHGIPTNTVDNTACSDVIFPAILRRGRLTVAISTDGASPTAAKRIRTDIEQTLPTAIEPILDWLARLREIIRKRAEIPPAARPALYRALVNTAFEFDRPLTEAETEAIIEMHRK